MVVTVREETTEQDKIVLQLMVCAVPWVPYSSANASSGFSSVDASVGVRAVLCANATVDVDERAPGFISVGFLGVRPLQKSGAASGAELWVVGVLGVVFELELGETAVLRVVGRSQLTARSFVQVGGAWQVQQTLSGRRADAHAIAAMQCWSAAVSEQRGDGEDLYLKLKKKIHHNCRREERTVLIHSPRGAKDLIINLCIDHLMALCSEVALSFLN